VRGIGSELSGATKVAQQAVNDLAKVVANDVEKLNKIAGSLDQSKGAPNGLASINARKGTPNGIPPRK